ncbi:SDA1-domain-containing protein [Coniella lustricola]|uniref:Protein SDA1 n=1 Tax=Coniella lustricola TaxID=2025994 RepID=A0A2T3AIW2_9PEZI|nr:SDA1-domain-containing protein [Coniella lustricola]
MGKRKVGALDKLDADLASLQFKVRSDPKSYQDEFDRQYTAYLATKEVFLDSPATATRDVSQDFHDKIDFIAHVAECFKTETKDFPDDLKTILTEHHAVLDADVREKLVGSLVLLRRKELISSEYLLTTLFPILVSTPSKSLRALLYQKIVSDLRNANSRHTNHPLNRTIQNVLSIIITSDRSSSKGIWAVRLTREMWRRQIWTDAKPVEVMKEACLSDNAKVIVGGTRFFLGGDKEREEMEDDSSDEETIDLKKMQHQQGINKKTKKKAKQYKAAVDKVKRQERKKNAPHPLNFSALHLLHDPQGFAEQLFQKHLANTKAKLTLENKLLVLQLVTRLVGLHKLTVMSLYSWFIKFLTPKQSSVTSFLASLAQATHNLVPPDAIEPLIMKIANEFVSEAAAAEVAAAGLNAIREICARQPLAMTETLLQDLVQYRKSKDKGVMMAAKGLLSLYREVGAELLKKRDRGKEAVMGLRSGDLAQRKFGEQEAGGIEGLELLEKWKEEERKKKRVAMGLPEEVGSDEEPGAAGEEEDDGFKSEDWDVESVDSSDSGGWIAVSSDEEGDDKPPPAKRQRKASSEAPQLVDATADAAAAEAGSAQAELQRMSKLATTTILTPADLVKLQELRLQASVDKTMGGNKSKHAQQLAARHADDPLTAEQIELPAKLRKTTKEERLAMAKEGKPNREEHKSTQAIRKSKKEAEGKSTSNKEKARKKNFLMTIGKAKQKQKRSLVQTKKVLQAHISRSKKGGRTGNF